MKTSSLTFTFENVTKKSIGTIYPLVASTYQVWQLSSRVVKKYWADIAWFTYRLTNRPTDKCKAICHLFSKGGIKNKNLILVLSRKGVKRYWADNICTGSLTLTFDHVIWAGIIYSLGESTVPSLATFQQSSQGIGWTTFFSKTSSLTLTYDHVTWKSLGVI